MSHVTKIPKQPLRIYLGTKGNYVYESKESLMSMSIQIENVNKETEIILNKNKIKNLEF